MSEVVTGLIAVTGATGGLGGRVASRLAARGTLQRLIVRDLGRAPALPDVTAVQISGYDDAAAMRAALDGVTTLFFASAAEHPERVKLHRGVVDAAVAAGVSRIVYTSFAGATADATFTFARDHFHTEQYIRSAGLDFVFLRDSLYLDFIPNLAGADDVIRGPAGDGRFAPVSRDDIADVAAAVLTDRAHDGSTLELTGPVAVSMEEAAAALSDATGRPISYHDETLDEAYASRATYDAAPFEVEGWITTYLAIAKDELSMVTDTVELIAKHPAAGLRDYLAARPLTS